jgi:hypothetical protein
MSSTEIILILASVTILGGFLLRKHRRPVSRQAVEWSFSKQSDRAFEAAPLRPRMQQLRQNHLVGLPDSSQSTGHRRALVASARQALGRLSFFKDRTEQHEYQSHAA